ncbi:MAG: hypothetical protein IH878_15785 [Gemmatimonadetes bacterium]|nr:hypothetical protein [Gemmatimonadota bacterium]
MDTIKLRPVEKTTIMDASCNFIRRAFMAGVPTAHIADVMNAANIPDQQDPDFTPPVDNYRAWTEDLIKHVVRLHHVVIDPPKWQRAHLKGL